MTVVAEQPVGLLAQIMRIQAERAKSESRSASKERGQFFTPPSVASFMAGRLKSLPSEIRLLDPGAGIGMLTAAVCERVTRLPGRRALTVDAFETDASVISSLEEVLKLCQRVLSAAGHCMRFTIHAKDFVLANDADTGLLFSRTIQPRYNAVIMNPPYYKIGKDSQYATALPQIIHGQPNVYAVFMALGGLLLEPGGQFVSITPRSYCNGPYFRRFRQWFFRRMGIQQVHVFESRSDTFREASVLQESIITVAKRQERQPERITISHSSKRDIKRLPTQMDLPRSLVIDDPAKSAILRLPVSPLEVGVIEAVEQWDQRFQALGLRVSTGPVVMFRTREFHVSDPADDPTAVPLLSMHNVRPFCTEWPVVKNGKPRAFANSPESRRFLVPAGRYVLIRRFSAKEERRRLTASWLSSSSSSFDWIAIENHLNYVYHADRSLAESEMVGITAMLNSRLLDTYFRTISGNTQVNAAEIRAMPFPSLLTLDELGRRIQQLPSLDDGAVEECVLSTLGIGGQTRQLLLAADR